MLMPMVVFILPTLFMLLLGPVGLRAGAALGGAVAMSLQAPARRSRGGRRRPVPGARQAARRDPHAGLHRLSELFNNAPGEFIGASMRMASTSATRSASSAATWWCVCATCGWCARSRRTPVRCGRGRIASAVPARVVMDLDDWQVTGDMHLVDRIPWLDYAATAQNRFISVSNASVRFVGVAEPLECEYLLVNGARISALYEVA